MRGVKDPAMRSLTTVVAHNVAAPNSALQLVVIGPDVFLSRPLPVLGELTIGRADTADVRVPDPLASRLHARLILGPGGTAAIEDLGSINKTKIRDVQLVPGQQVAIVPGEAITIGSTVLMVQQSASAARPRRVWPHSYFEARLEEECLRHAETKASFTALRLHVDGDTGPGRLAELVAPALRLSDMLALYGPGELELLLPNTTPELATAMAADLVGRLADAGLRARTGLACCPRDSRAPEALLALACERLRRGPSPAPSADGTVLEDPGMRQLYELTATVAAATINVLVAGETGVGKEVLAEAIHRLSPRAKARFLCVNCASLAETLLESELFGHEKGAFTGAVEAKPGLLESAPGGTVFLDEIGEMPLSVQAKLLRVLETRKIARLGSLKEREIDVRFVAATNRDLPTEVGAGRFRSDLYFRLNGITLTVPPLRDRPSEIAPLARWFAARLCRQMNRASEPRISAAAMQLLARHRWPGNVRELRNVIERALVLCRSDEIGIEHLPVESMTADLFAPVSPAASVPAAARAPDPTGTDQDSDEDERIRVLRVLNECAGNQSRAAKLLGMARSTLVAKLDAYRVPRPRKNA